MNLDNLHRAVYPIGRVTPQGAKLLGTCFSLDKPGLFATSLHVTDQNDTGLVIFSWDMDGLNNYQSPPTEYKFANAKIIAADPISDLCIVRIAGDFKSNIRITGSDRSSILEPVCIFGFPHATEGRSVLTVQTSSVGAKILLQVSGLGVKHLVLNIQTRPGQSGSPVFKSDDSTLIGIISGSYASPLGGIMIGDINPGSLNQTTYAVSSEYLTNMY